MGFLDHLRPHDEHFFGPLASMADHAAANAVSLRDIIANPAKGPDLLPRMRDQRKSLDDIAQQLEFRLAAAFIAPIDPEDIAALKVNLHELGDAIDDNARLFSAMAIDRSHPRALTLGDFLVQGAEQVKEATHSLRKRDVVHQATEKIRLIEREADAEYHTAISELFDGKPDPLMVLKWNDIYSRVEDLVDMVHHTGDVLDRIALKDV